MNLAQIVNIKRFVFKDSVSVVDLSNYVAITDINENISYNTPMKFKSIFTATNKKPINLIWKNDNTILVYQHSYNDNEISKKVSNMNGFEIKYIKIN